MPRIDRTNETADQIIDWILDGEITPDAPLPPESELAERCGVSRLTAREAIRLLQAQGVIAKVPGTRHRVAPVEEWTGLHAILRYDRRDPRQARSSVELLELRMMIETGSAALAATRRTEEQLVRLDALVEEMAAAHERGDVADFVRADLAFHEIVLASLGNRVLLATMRTLTELLASTRGETSASADTRVHALSWHRDIAEALRSGDPERARAAMSGHMQQTLDDLLHYVHGTQDRPGSSAS